MKMKYLPRSTRTLKALRVYAPIQARYVRGVSSETAEGGETAFEGGEDVDEVVVGAGGEVLGVGGEGDAERRREIESEIVLETT